MERLEAFGRYSKRVINRLVKREVKEDYDFTASVNEETRTISWCIRNISRCQLETGKYYDSPPFTVGFSSEIKWIIRIYPKGRKVAGNVAVFVKRISEDSRTDVSLKCCLQAKPITESGENSKEKPKIYTYDYPNKKHDMAAKAERWTVVTGSPIPPDGENVEDDDDENMDVNEHGIHNFMPVEYLLTNNSLLITCELTVSYLDEENRNCTTRPSVSSSLYNDLKEMYKGGKFSDVVLQVGKTSFPAHKAILATRSKVFAAMFEHNMTETQNNVINIEDVEPSVMNTVLQYMYTGKFEPLTIDEAASIFSAADKYSLEELQNWCVRVMLSKLSVENVCQIAILADMHSVPKLKNATNCLFRQYMHEIVAKKEWKKIIREKPQLASDILQAISSDFNTKF